MHITINSFGSRGDIQPYIALGKGLKQAGHSVRLLTHQIFEGFVRQHDLDFYPIQLDPRQVLVEQSISDFEDNPLVFFRWLRSGYEVFLEDLFRVTDQAAEGADLLINSGLSFAGYHVAEKHAIPAIAAYLQPVSPTRAFHASGGPPPPDWLPIKNAYNYLSNKLTNQLFFYLLSPLVNDSRSRVLNLPPLKQSYYWSLDTDGVTPMIYGYSPAVIPKPPDWGDNIQVTGYWFLESAQAYQPPERLAAFLNSGPPPVYIGFGSMVDHERQTMTNLIIDALNIVDCRAILLGGWSELGKDDLPENILQIDYAPHDWLFPKMAAVVHHGGAGTTAAGLKAGVPTVVVPFFGDQFFWGWWVSRIGVGPVPIPRKELTTKSLAGAILAAVSDETMKQKANALGGEIRSEDGISRAVDIIEQRYLGKPLKRS